MQTPTVKKRDVFIVTCETKFRKKVSSEIVLGVFYDEQIAKEQADKMFKEKRKQFLERVKQTSNFKPACLEDQTNCWVVSYWPSGSWDMKEFVKIHVNPNYILTDM